MEKRLAKIGHIPARPSLAAAHSAGLGRSGVYEAYVTSDALSVILRAGLLYHVL
jgi:hypothetical protein